MSLNIFTKIVIWSKAMRIAKSGSLKNNYLFGKFIWEEIDRQYWIKWSLAQLEKQSIKK